MKTKLISKRALLLILLLKNTLSPTSTDKAQQDTDHYQLIHYSDFITLLEDLKTDPLYNKYIRITNGFAHYNISPVPNCERAACQNPIIEIADFQKGSKFVRALPTVLLIAGFHGDEVVGTNALYRMLELLRRNLLRQNQWGNLLGNVRILILPMANVNGFYNLKREETISNGSQQTQFDPNRDFPYDEDPRAGCFVTSTAELIDAIFRDNIIVGCLTFHGGANSITYPWGNFPHAEHPETGDQVAFDKSAHILSTVAGENPALEIHTYEIGTLHDVVYDVRGGFEDWGYGASFDPRNIDKKCGRRSNPKFGLISNDITYNDVTNRAFLFLVEAGGYKIPKESALGNGIPLETDDYSKGTWGHVARNVNLSLRFAQLIGPFASVDRLYYKDNHLFMHLSINGCWEIDSISSSPIIFKEVFRKYNDRKNIWTLEFKTLLNPGSYKDVSLTILCDQKWGQPTNGQNPQSHFVRMRTIDDYLVEYKNFKLQSNKNLLTIVQNIRTEDLPNGLIHYVGRSQYALTYVSLLTSAKNSIDHKENKNVKLIFHEGKINLITESGENHFIKVHSYSTSNLPKMKGAARPRELFQIKTSEPLTMTSQNFLSLTGRSFELYEENKESPIYSSILALEAKPEDEDKNALPMPINGVSCYQLADDHFAYNFVSVTSNEAQTELSVSLFLSRKSAHKFRVGQFSENFQQSFGDSFTKQEASLQIGNIDELRLLSRTFEAFDKNDKKIFSCVLGIKDPYTDIPKELGFPSFEIQPNIIMNPFKMFFILLLFCTFGILIGMFLKKIFRGKRHEQAPAIDLNELSFGTNSSISHRP